MTAALLLLAAAATDLAFDAYGACAATAAASYKGSTETLETVVSKVRNDCANDQSALLAAAPDKRQAAEWIRMTTTLAVTEHAPGLRSAGPDAIDGQAPAAPATAVSRYPKLDAYRLCGEEKASKILAEIPYAAVGAVVAEAIADCEKPLIEAADETVAEMRQPSLKKQVVMDFRRRATTDLTRKLTDERAGAREAGR